MWPNRVYYDVPYNTYTYQTPTYQVPTYYNYTPYQYGDQFYQQPPSDYYYQQQQQQAYYEQQQRQAYYEDQQRQQAYYEQQQRQVYYEDQQRQQAYYQQQEYYRQQQLEKEERARQQEERLRQQLQEQRRQLTFTPKPQITYKQQRPVVDNTAAEYRAIERDYENKTDAVDSFVQQKANNLGNFGGKVLNQMDVLKTEGEMDDVEALLNSSSEGLKSTASEACDQIRAYDESIKPVPGEKHYPKKMEEYKVFREHALDGIEILETKSEGILTKLMNTFQRAKSW
ncbi:unnamed protein product, partial [Didymodactylos carnosus]